MRDKIAELLEDEFSYVYCETCGSEWSEDEVNYHCDGCRRKSMNWCLSKDAAQRIATSIMRILEEE